MPKEFYTEKDIEDMFRRGILLLEVTDNVVLTELAYEKANRLGMKLLQSKADNPPSAPVRPYLSQPQGGGTTSSPTSFSTSPASPAVASASGSDLHARIRSAVIARLGTQVDSNLLDVIIKRVLSSTGVK